MSNMNPGQPYQAPQPSGGGSSALKIIMIVLGVLALGCICCAGAMYFGWGSLMGVANKEIYNQLKDIPAVQQEFGTLDENGVEMSIMGTAEYKQKNPDDEQLLVINVRGSKGSGQIMVKQNGEKFQPVKITKDGQTIDVEGLGSQDDGLTPEGLE